VTLHQLTLDSELRAFGGLLIDGSTVAIISGGNGILAGSVEISGGAVTIATGADCDGISAQGGDVVISGGALAVEIVKMFGIYAGNSVTLSGGSGTAQTSGDGLPAVMSCRAPVALSGGVIVTGWDGGDYTIAAEAAGFHYEGWDIDYHSFADADDLDTPLMNIRFEPHPHDFGDPWESDATNHWHECSCGKKSDIAAHTPGDWIVDLAATVMTDGSRHKECTTCGYVTVTKTIPATGAPVVTGRKNVKLAYLGAKELGGSVTGEGLTWSSGNTKSVTVDQTGKTTSVRGFCKTGSATIKVQNDAGYVEFKVKVRPTFVQWLMIVFLFGWIWY
jgi:hypothetical protein